MSKQNFILLYGTHIVFVYYGNILAYKSFQQNYGKDMYAVFTDEKVA